MFRQSAVILFLGWALMPLQFLTSALVARKVGPEGRGTLFLLAALTAVVVSLTNFGLTSAAAVLHRKKIFPAGELFGSVLGLVGLSALLVTALHFTLSRAFLEYFVGGTSPSSVEESWLALALLAVPITVLLELGDVLFINSNAMRVYAIRNTGTQLLSVLLVWVLLAADRVSIFSVLVIQLVALVFGLAVFLGWFLATHGGGGIRCSRSALRHLLRIGLQQSGVSIISAIGKRLDAFIITRLLSLEHAGYFAIANTIQNQFVNIPRAALWPLVAAVSAENSDRYLVLARVTRLLTVLMAVTSAVFMAISGGFIRFLFGEAFAPATIPVCFALLGVVATPVALGASALFTAEETPARLIIAGLPATLVRLALNFALVPVLGPSGSALALSANSVTIGAIQLFQVCRGRGIAVRSMLIPFKDDFRMLKKALRSRLPVSKSNEKH